MRRVPVGPRSSGRSTAQRYVPREAAATSRLRVRVRVQTARACVCGSAVRYTLFSHSTARRLADMRVHMRSDPRR